MQMQTDPHAPHHASVIRRAPPPSLVSEWTPRRLHHLQPPVARCSLRAACSRPHHTCLHLQRRRHRIHSLPPHYYTSTHFDWHGHHSPACHVRTRAVLHLQSINVFIFCRCVSRDKTSCTCVLHPPTPLQTIKLSVTVVCRPQDFL